MKEELAIAVARGPLLSPAEDETIRAHARDVLAQPAYTRWTAPDNLFERLQSWLDDRLAAVAEMLPDWVVALWDRLLEGASDAIRGLGATELATWRALVAIALFSLLVALAVLAVSALRRALGFAQPAPSELHSTDVGSLLAEAADLAKGGHYLDAAHRVQLAALELLLERRWLELARSDPNDTLRGRLRRSQLPDLERTDLLVLLDRIERNWFRDRVEDHALYDAWLGLHGRLARLPVSQ